MTLEVSWRSQTASVAWLWRRCQPPVVHLSSTSRQFVGHRNSVDGLGKMEGDIGTEVRYTTIGIPLLCVHTRMHVCCLQAPIRMKAIRIVCCMSFHLCYKKTRLYIVNVVVCMCMGGWGTRAHIRSRQIPVNWLRCMYIGHSSMHWMYISLSGRMRMCQRRVVVRVDRNREHIITRFI